MKVDSMKESTQFNALLSAWERPEKLEELVKNRKKEVEAEILKDWEKLIGLGEITKGEYKDDSKEEQAKRVIYGFVDIAKAIEPDKLWNAEKMLKVFESKVDSEGSPIKQLKSFLKSEFDKL